jgi:hypothetical protein
MNHLLFQKSEPGDALRTTALIVACVALGIAFVAAGIFRILSAAAT